MGELTLVIPAKDEAESLPLVLDELKKYNYNVIIVLHKTDISTINSIKKYNLKIVFQNNFGYGDALIKGLLDKDKGGRVGAIKALGNLAYTPAIHVLLDFTKFSKIQQI